MGPGVPGRLGGVIISSGSGRRAGKNRGGGGLHGLRQGWRWKKELRTNLQFLKVQGLMCKPKFPTELGLK